jgi:hypothetical protein
MSMVYFATRPVGSGPTNGRRQHGPTFFLSKKVFFISSTAHSPTPPIRPASIRTSCGAAAPCQLGSSILETGAAISNAALASNWRSGQSCLRSHPNSAVLKKAYCLDWLSCCG